MTVNRETNSAFADPALLAGRILVVVQLLPNGLRKIANFEQTAAMMGGAPPQMIDGRLFPAQEPLFYFPVPELFLAASILFDIALSILVIVGLKARPAALLLAGYVVLAAVIYHSDIRGPQDIGALVRILPFVGGLLLVACAGAGRWSLDAWLGRTTAAA